MSDPAPQEQLSDPAAQEQDATKKKDRRRGPRPPRPSIDKMFGSSQNSIEDINVHIFDIANGKQGLSGYLGTLSTMKFRQLRWSPVVVCGIPVTPIENPKTNSSSFFIIRLIDSTKPRYKVDLLIKDSDLYFVGFRRELVLEPEEEEAILQTESTDKKKMDKKMRPKEAAKAAKKASKKRLKAGWGGWHRFFGQDVELPDYFKATSCGVSASYGLAEATAGGWETFKEILTALGTFDDGCISQDRLQRACYSVMIMICEASRLRSVFNEVLFRLVHNCARSTLNEELSKNITNWRQMGALVLKARLNGHMGLDEELDEGFTKKLALVKDRKHEIKELGDLIDEHQGEVLLIKYDLELLGYTMAEVDRMRDQAKQWPSGGPAGRKELDFSH